MGRVIPSGRRQAGNNPRPKKLGESSDLCEFSSITLRQNRLPLAYLNIESGVSADIFAM
jgi:hypothetical protein